MAWRMVNIVKSDCLADLRGMRSMPEIKRLWELPLEYVLYEFYHPDQQAYSSERDFGNEELKRKAFAAQKVEEELLSPLYKGLSQPQKWKTCRMNLPLPSAHYSFYSRKPIQYPEIHITAGWDSSKKVEVKINLLEGSFSRDAFYSVLEQWKSFFSKQKILIRSSHITKSKKVHIDEMDFTEQSGDACAALIALIAEVKKTAGIEAITFQKIS